VPFATYLVAIHNRIHPIFADGYLESLDNLQKDDPLNDMRLSSTLEIVLDTETGKIVQVGVVSSSGLAAFDGAALISVERAAPFGKAPDGIASPDGNVYLHWEFHRDPDEACTTRHARPYRLASAPALLHRHVDKSRPVQFPVGQMWNCPFPPGTAAIDSATVSLRVTVEPDGTASNASILSDPGRGFGPAARTCVVGRRYAPALDRNGTPMLAFGIVWVSFVRRPQRGRP
jgi:hypothetical protein